MITYHALGSNVRMRLLIVDGTGAGSTAQTPTAIIRRRSDSKFWNGATWQTGVAVHILTEEDATNLPGTYYYDFDHTTAGGEANEYLVRYTNTAAPPLMGTDEEQHVFRAYSSSLVPERRLGHVLADDGVTLRIAVWVEEGGQRVNDYTSITMQIKDDESTLVVNLGVDASDTTDGIFSFTTPITAISRNIPYVLTAQALRGTVTDNYNAGFVRV